METPLECREVYDLKNYTITLLAPDGSVLRHDQYDERSFPAVFMNLPPDVASVTQVQWRTQREIDRFSRRAIADQPSTEQSGDDRRER